MIDLYNGDCLEIMKQIPSKSVDFICKISTIKNLWIYKRFFENLNRNFIGIGLDKEYFKIAKDRICEESWRI